MPEPVRHNVYIYIALLLVLAVIAGVAGMWAGERSVQVTHGNAVVAQKPEPTHQADAPAEPKESPPVYLYTTLSGSADQTVVCEEIKMAAAEGIHQYVLRAPLPWQGDMKVFLEPIEKLVATDPDARILVSLALDPPGPWLEAHPGEVAKTAEPEPAYVSVGSTLWIEDLRTPLEALVRALTTSQGPERVQGYVLSALHAGQWRTRGGYDRSEANTARFRAWLARAYADDAALQAAWGSDDVTLATANVPEPLDTRGMNGVFFPAEEAQQHADYAHYLSERTAEVIAGLAGQIEEITGPEAQILAMYGYSFEVPSNTAGHLALKALWDSAVDGFVSPVSYVDRGLGGVGGIMGPVDSALAHGKTWFVIDDTRTGLTRDPATGEIARPKNLRAQDVYSVQQRNFVAAALKGLGVLWSDARGTGTLYDQEMWLRFGSMLHVYEEVHSATHSESEADILSDTIPTVAVVVDESSRFMQRADRDVNALLLTQMRDVAVRTGVVARFYLLSDVLEGHAEAAPVYLFLNTFCLTKEEREDLHKVLREQQAAAIWMYAPGYIDEEPSVDNIAETTCMGVKAFEGPAKSGSVCALSGRWVGMDEAFGQPREWAPLFYIDDPDVDAIARYSDSGQPSVGAVFFEEGWSSIYCAEPCLTPGLLRDILSILELHVCFQAGGTKSYDATYVAPGFIGIHAQKAGERTVELDRVYDIHDLLNPEIGWRRKRTFVVPLKAGETRLLQLTPIALEE